MAERPVLELTFDPGGCPDCGRRRARMPPLPVRVPDDIDLGARDFEGFRQLMLDSLALDNPDRERWSEADMEVALVELLAAALDRQSHALDALFAEHFLVTAQWPRSVVRHLTMIDGVAPAMEALRGLMRPEELDRFGFDAGSAGPAETLHAVLTTHPQLIETAKAAALDGVTRIESLISLDDLARRLAEVPLVSQVAVRHLNEGGVAIREASVLLLDSAWRTWSRVGDLGEAGEDFVDYFRMAAERLRPPDAGLLSAGSVLDDLSDDDIRGATVRTAVSYLVSPLLPLSSRLRLIDGRRVGVYLRLCVVVSDAYFRSEVEMAVREVLSAGPGGFFAQENFGFGQPLYLSDLQEALSALDGVEGVILNRVQFVGRPQTDATAAGVLRPPPNRALTLDADNPAPDSGYYTLKLQGGLIG